MKNAILLTVCLLLTCPVFLAYSGSEPTGISDTVHFIPLHVYIDSGDETLAAFQFELETITGQVEIVGVEGGEHAAFNHPPYYDPTALMNDRIIIAAYSTDTQLPTGLTRVATLHLQVTGDFIPEFDLQLTTAADSDGRRIQAQITYEQGDIQ